MADDSNFDDRIVRCRNWMRKIIDAPNVDGWQNMVDTPDDDFTDPDFADDDEIKRKDFNSRYPEYVKKVMLQEKKYKGKEISDEEYEEYEERMSKNFKDTELPSEKKEKEPEDKTLKEKESYEEKQERYFKRFEAMQKKYPYLTDTEISEKLRTEDEKVNKDKEICKSDKILDKAKKDYERIHGNNSFYVQIERIYKLMKNGIEFDTAFKKCKIQDSYKKHIMKALQKLEEKLKEKK